MSAKSRASIGVRYSAQMEERFAALAQDLKGETVPRGRPWGRLRRLHDQALREFLTGVDPQGAVSQFQPVPTSAGHKSLYLDAAVVEMARAVAQRFDLNVQTVIYNAFVRFLERHRSQDDTSVASGNSAKASASSANAA